MTQDLSKYCSKCGQTKPVEEFYQDRRKKCGLVSSCKPCHNSAVKNYHVRGGARVKAMRVGYARGTRLRLVYGITPKQYDLMFANQGGVCALCGESETKTIRGKGYSLTVDHDHTSGRVRSLLCNSCNRAIGGLKDDPELLRKAADYIEKFRPNCPLDTIGQRR